MTTDDETNHCYQYLHECNKEFQFMEAVMGEAWIRENYSLVRLREWAYATYLRGELA